MTPSEIHKRQELQKLLFILESDECNQNVINRVEELQRELGIYAEKKEDESEAE